MKVFSTLTAGALFALALTFVQGASIRADTRDDVDKVYRDDDLSRLTLDQDRSTVNQIPKEQHIEGSDAGGIRDDEQDELKPESSHDREPGEQAPIEPDTE